LGIARRLGKLTTYFVPAERLNGVILARKKDKCVSGRLAFRRFDEEDAVAAIDDVNLTQKLENVFLAGGKRQAPHSSDSHASLPINK
jgi:hypothetical protein